MAKVTPFWTIEAETPAVYHNQSECSEGKKIKPQHKQSGTPPAGRRLCKVCADL